MRFYILNVNPLYVGNSQDGGIAVMSAGIAPARLHHPNASSAMDDLAPFQPCLVRRLGHFVGFAEESS